MQKKEYLRINGILLPLPVKYAVRYPPVVSQNSGITEAGTKHRDLLRRGAAEISAAFCVSPVWLEKLSAFSYEERLLVSYFSPMTLSSVTTAMYMENYSSELAKDTSRHGIWNVSFSLYEY